MSDIYSEQHNYWKDKIIPNFIGWIVSISEDSDDTKGRDNLTTPLASN